MEESNFYMNKKKLTILIPTREEDLRPLRNALRSAQWTDEILLVDSSFSDKVAKIGKEFGAKVLCHKYAYSAKQKNWAISKAKHNWILLLDSDEVITAKLKMTIEKILDSQDLEKYDGFGIARKHFFFGKFLRWGGRYPLYQVRLFRKSCRYEDRDVHAHIILEKDKIGYIKPKDGDLLHDSDRNFKQFFERFDRYSTYQAHYMKKIADQKKKINWKEFLTNGFYFKAVVKDIWFFVPLSSIFRFMYMYLFRLGILDGREGFLIAVLYALQDYISKTKYYFLTSRRPVMRVKMQDMIMDSIASMDYFKDNKLNFLESYKKIAVEA